MLKISRENKVCYLMGDFNLNLMNYQSSPKTGEFLDSIYSNMFYPLISRPTRITSYTATLIDNIFTNNIDNLMTSGLLFNDLSDHLPIFVIDFDDIWFEDHSDQFVVYRDRNPSNMTRLNDQLGSVDWSVLESINVLELLIQLFTLNLQKFTILVFQLKKGKLNVEEFINHGYLKSF